MALTAEEKQQVKEKANAWVARLDIGRKARWLWLVIPLGELAYFGLKPFM